MENKRTLELLNKLIDKMIEDEGMKPRAVIMDLLELGFTPDELIELSFDHDEVSDLAAEYQE